MELMHLDVIRDVASSVVREISNPDVASRQGGSEAKFLDLLPRSLQIISNRTTDKGYVPLFSFTVFFCVCVLTSLSRWRWN